MLEGLFKSVSTGLTILMSLPGPGILFQLALAKPSEIQHLFPTREIPASQTSQAYPNEVIPLFERVPWKGNQITVSQFLQQTKAQAFLAIYKGSLVHEWYANGIDATTKLPSYSVGKSIVSLLAGQTIEAGLLSEDAKLVSVLPELKSGTKYDDIAIQHLLDMQSGVDVSEKYTWLQGTMLMALTKDLPGFVRHRQELKFKPGAMGEYRSIDTQLLGMAVARVEGQTLSKLLAERIWIPMGAQDNATWNLDRKEGLEKAFCCINATARDFAKIGSLVLHNGMANGKQIISRSWIERLRTPVGDIDGWQYAAQWWHFGQGDFGAVGIHGQYIYIDPHRDIVLVKLSNYGAEQDEKETIEALRAISAELSQAQRQRIF